MNFLETFSSWAKKLTDVGVSIIALGVVLEVLFKGAAIPFWPEVSVVDNIMGIKGCGPVKAEKLIGPCKTEQEMFDVCVKAYNDDGQNGVERVTENGHLLWLLRHPNQPYQPPSNSQGLTGQSSTEQTSANTEDATQPLKPSISEKE